MLDNLRMKLLGLPRRYKRMLQVAADVSLVWLSLWLAFLVRLGTEDMISPFGGHAWLFIAAPLVAIPLFIRFGMYRAVMRYLGNDALIAIAKAVTISALVLSLLVYWYRSPPAVVPRSLVFNYWWLSMLLIGGLRLAMRQYFMGRLVLCCAVGTISQSPGRPAQGGHLWRWRGRQPVGCGIASRSGDASGGVHR
jgi:FlaA1/EpsC-like NDP-sugar epimerase